MQPGKSPIETIPADVLRLIASHLAPAEVAKLQTASKNLKSKTDNVQVVNKQLTEIKVLIGKLSTDLKLAETTAERVQQHQFRVGKSWLESEEKRITELGKLLDEVQVSVNELSKRPFSDPKINPLAKECVKAISDLQLVWSKVDSILIKWKKFAG